MLAFEVPSGEALPSFYTTFITNTTMCGVKLTQRCAYLGKWAFCSWKSSAWLVRKKFFCVIWLAVKYIVHQFNLLSVYQMLNFSYRGNGSTTISSYICCISQSVPMWSHKIAFCHFPLLFFVVAVVFNHVSQPIPALLGGVMDNMFLRGDITGLSWHVIPQ